MNTKTNVKVEGESNAEVTVEEAMANASNMFSGAIIADVKSGGKLERAEHSVMAAIVAVLDGDLSVFDRMKLVTGQALTQFYKDDADGARIAAIRDTWLDAIDTHYGVTVVIGKNGKAKKEVVAHNVDAYKSAKTVEKKAWQRLREGIIAETTALSTLQPILNEKKANLEDAQKAFGKALNSKAGNAEEIKQVAFEAVGKAQAEVALITDTPLDAMKEYASALETPIGNQEKALARAVSLLALLEGFSATSVALQDATLTATKLVEDLRIINLAVIA